MKPVIAPTWADEQLAALHDRHPGGDFWHVPASAGPTRGDFCARPSGAMIATCQADTTASSKA